MALGSELTGRCVSRVVCVWFSQACSSDRACWNWPRANRAASNLCCSVRKTRTVQLKNRNYDIGCMDTLKPFSNCEPFDFRWHWSSVPVCGWFCLPDYPRDVWVQSVAPGSCLCPSDLKPSSTRALLDGRASPYQSVADKPQPCTAAQVKREEGCKTEREKIYIFDCLMKM